MKVDIEKKDKGQVELTIELTVDEYQPFLIEAAKKISESVKISGFRPGKADLETIKQRVGEGQVWQEAIDPAIRRTFAKALGQEKLITIGSPQIDVVKLAPGNPVIYKATVNLLPNVEVSDYSKITIAKKPVEIKEEEIKKVLSDLQKSRAKETLAEKKAEKNDKVEIDFETFLDKIPVDRGKNEKFPLLIGEGTFIPGFEDQLIGMAKDEKKEFKLEFPKNYHQKNLAGRLVDFKVKVNAVYKLDFPELNDEFAKSLGDFKTFQELENQIKDNLEKEARKKENQRLEEEMIDKIIDQSKFDAMPDLLVNSETKKMIEELKHNITHQGLKFEDYLIHLNKKAEDLLLDFAPQAIKRIKGALIMRKVAEKENIKISEEEINNEVQKTLQMYADNPETEKQLKHPAYRDYLKNILSSRKVIEHLKSVMVK